MSVERNDGTGEKKLSCFSWGTEERGDACAVGNALGLTVFRLSILTQESDKRYERRKTLNMKINKLYLSWTVFHDIVC